MATVQNLVVNLLGNAKQLSSTMKAARAEVSALSDHVGSQVVGISGKLAGMAAGLLGGISLGAGVKLAADFEALQTQMQVLTGDTKVANQLITDLRSMGARTPFETADLVQGTQTLLAMGRTAGQVLSDIDMLSNIAAGDANKLGTVTTVFGQIASAGKLTGDNLNQLINLGFNPLNLISKRTGESMSELRARMEAGNLSFAEVQQAFIDATSAGGLFFNMNEKMSKTLSGVYSTMKDEISTTLMELGQTLVDQLDLKDLVTGTTEKLQALRKSIVETFGTALQYIRAYGPIVVSAGAALLTFVGVLNAVKLAQLAAARAQAAWLALTGPKGWAVIAGAAAATGAFGLSLKLMGAYTDEAAQAVSAAKQELAATSAELKKAGEAGNAPAAVFQGIKKEAASATTQIQKLQDEIAVILGLETEASQTVRNLMQDGVGANEANQVGQLMVMRDDLKKQADERKRIADEAEQARKQQQDELKNRAESLIDATRTPMEQFRQRVQEMRELLAQGLIDDETFQRGLKKAQDDLAQAQNKTGGTQARGASTLAAGSTEAARAIAMSRGASAADKVAEKQRQQQIVLAQRQAAAAEGLLRLSPLQIRQRKMQTGT